MKKFEYPIAYNNLIIAALQYAKNSGLYNDSPDKHFIYECIDDILESTLYPLAELDKDATIIIEGE